MFGISQPTIGRLEAILSSFLGSFTFYFIKVSPLPANQIGYIRALVNLPILLVMSKLTNDPIFGDWERVVKCCTRGLMGMIGNYLMMMSNKLLNITVFSMLSRFNVFGVILLNVLMLGNAFKWLTLLMAVLSVVGVTLVVAPGVLGFSSGGSGLEFKGTPEEYLGLLTAAGFIAASSFTRVFISSISNDVGLTQSIFFLNMFFCNFCGFISQWNPMELPYPPIKEAVIVGFLTFIGQIFYTDSMRREPDPSVLAVIQMSGIIFNMSLDFLLLGTQISLINVIGALLVMISTTVSMIKK